MTSIFCWLSFQTFENVYFFKVFLFFRVFSKIINILDMRGRMILTDL